MKHLSFVVLLVVLLAFPSNARADVAPPYNPPGSNLQPGAEVTQVRMVAETVLIEVQKDITPDSLGRAHVTADFTMHNLGSVDESMAVRFPIAASDERSGYPEINNVQIKVNGKPVRHRRVDYPEINVRYGGSSDTLVPWAEFDVMFPAGQDVPIQVAYDLKGTGYYPYTAFYYVLVTGAGWKDTIGSADIILRLPYEASLQNVILSEPIGWADTTPGGVFQGDEVRWHFDSLEPEQNMEFALVAPSAWQAVLTARDTATKHPNDGEAWGMLGKAYKGVIQMKGNREDVGGQELYQLSVEAYEKCLSLKPKDAQWHAGFADLLASHVMWNYFTLNTDPDTYRALNEIRTALELAPNDPVVREVAVNMTYMLHEGMDQIDNEFSFPWLTQTPTAIPTWTPSAVPVVEATATTPAAPASTMTGAPQALAVSTRRGGPEATSTPTPQKSSPLCGSAAFLPLIAAACFVWKRR